MIANPLVWTDLGGGWLQSGGYAAFPSEDYPGFFMATHRLSPEILGRFESMEAAQAACERHHQVAYARWLTQETRDKIRFNTNDTDVAVFEILDEAEAAERAKQLAKAGAT